MKFRLALHIGLLILVLISGTLLSNYTYTYLNKPATQIMGIVKGNFDFFKKKKKDSGEIPKVFYPRLGKAVYYPMTVANRAVRYYRKVMAGEDTDKSREIFLRHVEWLKNNLKIHHRDTIEFGLWESDFPYPYGIYDLEVPWRSAMVQGSGISALTKAYELTKDKNYLDYAKKALMAFFIDVKSGGVSYKDQPDQWWFEEYAGSKKGEPRVFNGAIYSLLDIHYYWEITKDKNAGILFEKGLNSIRNNLSTYDTGWWTFYDALGNIATKHYHEDHIKLTRKLYEITQDATFLEISEKWAKYHDNYFLREFLRQRPDYHDMTILGLNLIFSFIIVYAVWGILFFYYRTKKSNLHAS